MPTIEIPAGVGFFAPTMARFFARHFELACHFATTTWQSNSDKKARPLRVGRLSRDHEEQWSLRHSPKSGTRPFV